MTVKIVAYTKPCVDGIESIGEFVAYAARVSNPSNQMNSLTAPKLLKYCAKNSHWSVFEMANVVMEINTTRDIARQILRHRSFSFQEFSQRYADAKQLGFVTREPRFQDTKNRQNSIELKDMNDKQSSETVGQSWIAKQQQLIHEIEIAYKWALEQGIAKEQARSILPEGNIMSRMYVNGNLRSWIHYCHLRMGPETQKEHRVIAQECWWKILDIFPELNDFIDNQ